MLPRVPPGPDRVNANLFRLARRMTGPAMDRQRVGMNLSGPDSFEERQGGTRRRIDLVPVVGFDDLDVEPIEGRDEIRQHPDKRGDSDTQIARGKDGNPLRGQGKSLGLDPHRARSCR